jgi:hypothetical protein
MYVPEVDTFAPRLRERWPMVTLAALFLVVSGALVFLNIGPTSVELGKVVRLGVRGDSQPTVIVRTMAGEQLEIVAPAGSLRGCVSGDDIELLRKANRVEVAPVGCP